MRGSRPRRLLVRLLAVAMFVPLVAASADMRRTAAGAPHLAVIDLVALSPDGNAALTRDQRGALRLWSALDGSVEPIRVPVEAPMKLALARQGNALTLTIVDSAGGGHIFNATANGKVTEVAALPPTDPWLDLRPVPGSNLIVGLATDATIRLLGSSGKAVAKLEERGFAPQHLCLSSDGARLLTYEATGDTLRRVKLDGAKQTLALDGDPIKVAVEATDVRSQIMACSNDAQRWATLVTNPQTPDKSHAIVVDASKGSVARHAVPAQAQASLPFFLSDTTLLFSSVATGSPSWRVDLVTGRVTPRPSRNDTTQFVGSVAAANGRLVSAFGQWLRVDDGDGDDRLYLGYAQFGVAMGAVSPGKGSDRVVAWLLGTTLRIEALEGGGPAKQIEIREGVGANGFTFIDRDHLALLDVTGALRLVAWRTGKEIDRTEGGIGWAPITYEPTSGLLHVAVGNEHRLFEVSIDKGFGPPHIIFDTSWMGGLLAVAKAGDAAFWTLDGAAKRRMYTLQEIRRDLTWEEMLDRQAKDPLPMTPNAFDAMGRSYVLRYEPSGAVIDIYEGTDRHTLKVGGTDVIQVVPARDGKRVMVNRSLTVDVYDVATDSRLWGWTAITGIQSMTWSNDGAYATVTGISQGTTAAVLDAATGSIVMRRCAGGFEVKKSMPTFIPDATESIPEPAAFCGI